MRILYASNICSDKEFKRIYDLCSTIKPLQSIQRFNKLLCKGFIKHENVKLDIITSAPVNRKMCKKIIWKQKNEEENNILYHYCFMLNFPIVKFISLFFSSIFTALHWCFNNKKEECCIIYDAYCPVIANMTTIIANLFKIKIIGLYTDLPQYMNSNLKKSNLLKRFFKKIYQSFDRLSNKIANGYILLTEQMNELVNKQRKPYVVVEGVVDTEIELPNKLENKYKEFTIMYAGGIYEKFGILDLIKAVEQIENENIKLVLYGNGDMEKILNSQYQHNRKIKYGGVLENRQIVEEELKSTILVNPRFSNEEYTKYSFPSKNMEYMVSGTPVLTTKLSGMPIEYNEYVYLIEDESIEGMKKSIETVMSKNRDELQQKGKRAQEFVLLNKNNKKQAEKILELIWKIKR